MLVGLVVLLIWTVTGCVGLVAALKIVARRKHNGKAEFVVCYCLFLITTGSGWFFFVGLDKLLSGV